MSSSLSKCIFDTTIRYAVCTVGNVAKIAMIQIWLESIIFHCAVQACWFFRSLVVYLWGLVASPFAWNAALLALVVGCWLTACCTSVRAIRIGQDSCHVFWPTEKKTFFLSFLASFLIGKSEKRGQQIAYTNNFAGWMHNNCDAAGKWCWHE